MGEEASTVAPTVGSEKSVKIKARSEKEVKKKDDKEKGKLTAKPSQALQPVS